MSEQKKFYGKYRGTVSKNMDPEKLGRILVQVPDISNVMTSNWAMPCVPYAGKSVGFFAIPPEKANVWVEFEQGNPDYPIWTGCFWGSDEVPADPATSMKKVIKTDAGSITFNDVPGAGGITIETTTGMKIAIDEQGIEITNGKGGSIKITGTKVSVNDGALEVV